MCGINGFNFEDKKILQSMNKSISHRGPDNVGSYTNKKISLGHQRLSIQDLSSDGNQPMVYTHKGKEIVIVFNGEIYNFQEIKKDLKDKGYGFVSNSDTEVIIASYIEWGTSCVERFNGMWAFCIYDPQKNIFFLSRDRLGQKPLYYYHEKNKFIFSSEIKGILAHKIKKEVSKEATDLYFSMGFIPSPFSIYKNIFKLEPCQNLILNLTNNTLKKSNYYIPPKYNPHYNKSYLINEGRELIKDATRLRLIADVPTGAFLSGGVDSSAITSEIVNHHGRENLHTYSIGFEDEYDETKYINLMESQLKVKHHHKYFKEKDFENQLKNLFFHYDEPFADYSNFPTMELSKFAKKTLTVSLSGDGGDEIFGGYPRHKMAAQMVLIRKIPRFFRLLSYKLISRINLKSTRKIKEGFRLSLLPKDEFFSEVREDFYKPEIYKRLSKKNFSRCLDLSNGNLTEATILMDRYYNTLADNFLCKVDRASMAYALEVRSPFLDYRLIEFASKIPTKYKATIFKEKILLKKIFKDLLPAQIIKRKKQGFTPPLDKWMDKPKYQNETKEALENLFKTGLISKNWYQFYKKVIFTRDDFVSQNYKIRLFLFNRWYKYWLT